MSKNFIINTCFLSYYAPKRKLLFTPYLLFGFLANDVHELQDIFKGNIYLFFSVLAIVVHGVEDIDLLHTNMAKKNLFDLVSFLYGFGIKILGFVGFLLCYG